MNDDIFSSLAELLQTVLPSGWEKVRLYSQLNNSSYEFFFYVKIDNTFVQCFNLEKDYGISRKELRQVFKKMYKILLPTQEKMKWFVMTFLLSNDGTFKADYEYKDYSENTLEYKDIWETKYLR